MQISLPANELLAAAKHAAVVLPTQATRSDPDRGLLLLDASSNDTLSVLARGIGTQSEEAIEADVVVAGSVAIAAAPLLGLLAGLGDEELKLEHAGPVVVVRTESRRRFQIPTARNVVPPLRLSDGCCELALTTEQAERHFGKLLRQCTRANPPGPIAGIHITVTDGELRSTATNGTVLAAVAGAVSTSGTPLPAGVIVSCDTAQEICALARSAGDVALQLTAQLIAVVAGRRSFISTVLDATFPSWRAVVPPPCTAAIELDRAATVAALGRLAALAEPRLSGVALATWRADAARVELHLVDEPDSATDFVSATARGSGRMTLPIKSLLRLLEAMPVDRIRIEQADARAIILVSSPQDPGLTILHAPVRGGKAA